jgi:hypothetical protein
MRRAWAAAAAGGIPDLAAFPGGIAAVARQVHAEGLKFGLYVTPGIPEHAVLSDTAIKGSAETARQIADTSVTERNYNCRHMYGIDHGMPGAQDYIDSWADVALRFDAVAHWQPYGGPHGWNDEDSLEIGNGAADGLTFLNGRPPWPCGHWAARPSSSVLTSPASTRRTESCRATAR